MLPGYKSHFPVKLFMFSCDDQTSLLLDIAQPPKVKIK